MPAKRPSGRPPKRAPKTSSASKPSASKRAASTSPASSDDAGVQAWLADAIAARPERKQVLLRIDAVLRASIPDVVAGIKYRKPSQPLGVPFYGRPGTGWIAMVHSLKHEVRVTFFAGSSLDPPVPIPSVGGTRRVDLRDVEDLDEGQLRSWARQASKLPGWGKV